MVIPPERSSAIQRCARGEIPATVALMHTALAAREAADVERELHTEYDRLLRHGAVPEAERIGHAIHLWHGAPGAFALVKKIADVSDHRTHSGTLEQKVERWAKVFDAAAEISPEASVALYSLGDPRVLHAVTGEVADRMRAWGLVSVAHSVLDVGCGIGRFVRALAPEVRSIAGIDVSRRMVETARARCADLANATFFRRSAHDLTVFDDASFDLVYSVDTFPYLGEADLAAACLHQVVRVLKPGGKILVLNWSYRGDPDADRTDVRRLADELDLTVVRNGTSEFELWDGFTFMLQRASQ